MNRWGRTMGELFTGIMLALLSTAAILCMLWLIAILARAVAGAVS